MRAACSTCGRRADECRREPFLSCCTTCAARDGDTHGVMLCAWWMTCPNDATGTMPHPVLGDVPICDRCRAKVEALS